jgi:hypothetical protein
MGHIQRCVSACICSLKQNYGDYCLICIVTAVKTPDPRTNFQNFLFYVTDKLLAIKLQNHVILSCYNFQINVNKSIRRTTTLPIYV